MIIPEGRNIFLRAFEGERDTPRRHEMFNFLCSRFFAPHAVSLKAKECECRCFEAHYICHLHSKQWRGINNTGKQVWILDLRPLFERPLVAAVIRGLELQNASRGKILSISQTRKFSYGGKGREQPLSIMRQTISFLETFDPSAITIASNADKFHNRQRRLA